MLEQLQAELTVSELHNILANAMLFSAGATGQEELDGVLLSAHGGDVKASATDRYHVAGALAEADFVHPAFAAMIPGNEVKKLIAELKRFPKLYAGTSVLHVHQAEFTLRIQIPPADLTYDGCEMTLDLAMNRFPKLDSFFTNMPADPVGLFNIQPASLAKLAKVKRVDGTDKREPTQLVGGSTDTKPVTFRRGNWFHAVVMPAKIDVLNALHENRFENPSALSKRAQQLAA